MHAQREQRSLILPFITKKIKKVRKNACFWDRVFLCLVKFTVVFACLRNSNEIPPLSYAYSNTFILSCCHLPMLGLSMYFVLCTI